MRIAIRTLGSLGDVQPYVALALALAARGHDVQLAAPAQFEALVAGCRVRFAPLPAGFLARLRRERQARRMMRRLLSAEREAVMGFGSMPGMDPQHMTAIVVEALARAGRRGLLSSGGGALAAETLPPHVHLVDGAPHNRLLFHVSATIHHGGAGTTAASLRAGKPCAIVPFFGDQPFWARRVAGRRVGPPPLDRKTLSPDRLAAAIVAMDAEPMRERARGLGDLIGREDGAAAAASVGA